MEWCQQFVPAFIAAVKFSIILQYFELPNSGRHAVFLSLGIGEVSCESGLPMYFELLHATAIQL